MNKVTAHVLSEMLLTAANIIDGVRRVATFGNASEYTLNELQRLATYVRECAAIVEKDREGEA
jgi:hypothetical protein